MVGEEKGKVQIDFHLIRGINADTQIQFQIEIYAGFTAFLLLLNAEIEVIGLDQSNIFRENFNLKGRGVELQKIKKFTEIFTEGEYKSRGILCAFNTKSGFDLKIWRAFFRA